MMIKENDPQAEPVSEPLNAVKSTSIWTKLFMILGLVCLGFVGYTMWLWHQAIDMMHLDMVTIKTQQQQTTSQLSENAQHVEAIEAHHAVLDKKVSAVMLSQTDRDDDVLLQKVRHYLELAQLNATWGDDSAITSSLLSQADTVLSQIHGIQVDELRKAIAADNAIVKGHESIDVVARLNELSALQTLVGHLNPPATLISASATPSEKTETSPPASGWRHRLNESLRSLEKLVVIRRVDTDAEAFMTPARAALLRERIQLLLQETQFAVVRHQEALYQLTLKQSIALIQQSFDTQQPDVVRLLTQLQKLLGQSVERPEITINQSLAIVQQLIDAEVNKTMPPQSEDKQAGAEHHD